MGKRRMIKHLAIAALIAPTAWLASCSSSGAGGGREPVAVDLIQGTGCSAAPRPPGERLPLVMARADVDRLRIDAVAHAQARRHPAPPIRLAPLRDGPVVYRMGSIVVIGASRRHAAPATIWFFAYDREAPARPVPATSGEAGRSRVRDLMALGDWSGAEVRFELPPLEPGSTIAVLLQDDASGRCLAACAL